MFVYVFERENGRLSDCHPEIVWLLIFVVCAV